MDRHQIMNSFSTQWWVCIAAVSIVITLLLIIPYHTNWGKSKSYPKLIGLIIAINLITENVYAFEIGNWHITENLPLHLCGLSGLMGIFLMFRYSTTIAQVFYYWALIGGVYSLLTPEFDLGADGYFFYSYFINHASMILVAFYIILHCAFIPTKKSWLNAFYITQFAALCIGTFNWLSGSNYMYLSSPPIANNPLIIGEWPWYILIFEVLAFVHFYLVYKGFFFIRNITAKAFNMKPIK